MSSSVQDSEGSFQDPVFGNGDNQPAVTSPPRHEDETRRLQDEVVEAALRLEREAIERAAQDTFQLLPNNTVSFRIPVVRRPAERPSQDDTNERVWSALRTEFLPPPQHQGWGVPGIAMIAGSIGAVALAAAVALLVVNLIQVPSPSVSASGDDEAAKNESFSSAAVTLSRIAAAQAKMQSADDELAPPISAASAAPATAALVAPAAAAPDAPAAAAPAAPAAAAPDAPATGMLVATAAPANDVAVAKSTAPLPSPSQEVKQEIKQEIKPAATETAPSVAVAPPAAVPPAPAPEPQPTVTLSQDEITSLLKRGRDLIAAGDIASARLVLTHLSDAGVAEASFVLAGTFDPAVLESLRIVGMRPDPAKARLWYSRAAEQGSAEARQRLQALR